MASSCAYICIALARLLDAAAVVLAAGGLMPAVNGLAAFEFPPPAATLWWIAEMSCLARAALGMVGLTVPVLRAYLCYSSTSFAWLDF